MVDVFGISFYSEGIDALTTRIVHDKIPCGSGVRLVTTANVDHIVRLRKIADFRAAYDSAWAVTADGFPVYLYNLVRYGDAPSRITGADLFPKVMEQLNPVLHRVFFIGSTKETCAGLQESLLRRGFAESSVEICSPPFGFERDEEYSSALAHKVLLHRTTHLFIGVGAPKSEVWCYQHRAILGDCYVLSVGAGLEFFLGQKKRAPSIVQNIGMEWCWRFAHEPRRLFRRYFIESWAFFLAIADDLRQRPVQIGYKVKQSPYTGPFLD